MVSSGTSLRQNLLTFLFLLQFLQVDADVYLPPFQTVTVSTLRQFLTTSIIDIPLQGPDLRQEEGPEEQQPEEDHHPRLRGAWD